MPVGMAPFTVGVNKFLCMKLKFCIFTNDHNKELRKLKRQKSNCAVQDVNHFGGCIISSSSLNTISRKFKGTVSTSMHCTCNFFGWFLSSPFSWPTKMAKTTANQRKACSSHAA